MIPARRSALHPRRGHGPRHADPDGQAGDTGRPYLVIAALALREIPDFHWTSVHIRSSNRLGHLRISWGNGMDQASLKNLSEAVEENPASGRTASAIEQAAWATFEGLQNPDQAGLREGADQTAALAQRWFAAAG